MFVSKRIIAVCFFKTCYCLIGSKRVIAHIKRVRNEKNINQNVYYSHIEI